MKKIPIIFLLAAISAFSYAQTLQERKHIAGGNEAWVNFMKEMYAYPSFEKGLVEYRNGQRFTPRMNYNRVLETIQFINDSNDTLAIANEDYIKQVTIGSDVYLFLPQCLKTIASHTTVALYKHEKLRIADIRRKGAFGIPNSSSAIDSYNQVYTWMSSYQLNPNELLLLNKETSFYISGKDYDVVPASRKNVVQLFAKHDKRIKEFIDSKKTSFSNEKDLAELAEYISTL
jgi:hypothetical protein